MSLFTWDQSKMLSSGNELRTKTEKLEYECN